MRHLLYCLLLGLSTIATAQTYKISGVVADSLGNPLTMANVIAYQQDNNVGAFSITNQKGKYQLTGLAKDSTYVLKISYLGFTPKEDTVENLQSDLTRNYLLFEEAESLDAVNIVYEMPVSIKGDTIQYNADSFTNGTEDKLEDTLNKLPGIEVNEDGDVQVEGQNVEKIMVDGKDFFEGDTSLATKNIPADAIDKVQVLKNYNNRSQLKGLGNDQDRVVINLKLKEGKKNFWFGEITAGAGVGDDKARYLVQPKAFYYSEDFSVNILSDFNDLGTPAFTGRDYFRFIGFRRSDTRQNNSSINVQPRNTFNAFQNNRALEITSKFGAANASWSATDKLDLSAFAIVSQSDIETGRTSRNTFTSGQNEENTASTTDESTLSTLFKLGAEYNPTSALSISYDGRLNYSEQRERTLLSSIDQVAERDIVDRENQNPLTYNHSLNAYYTASAKHIFAVETQFLNQYEDPFYNAQLDINNFDPTQSDEPFNGQLGLTDSNIWDINQEQFINTNKIDAKLDYFYVLNKKSNINLTAGTTYVSQNYSSDIFQILDDESRDELQSTAYRNDNVQYDFLDLYTALHYKVVTGKFTFTPGLTLHQFTTEDQQLNTTNRIETTRLVPDAEIRYDIRSSESINFNYDQNVTFTDVNNYAQGIIFNNYNSLRGGNNQLTGSLNDRLSLRYRNFNMFNYTTIFGSVTYTKQREAIQSSLDLDGINQVSRPINFNLPNESISANGSFGREFKKVQMRLNARVSYSENSNIINNVTTEATNFNQTYGFTARSNFKDGLNFNTGYSINFNDSDNGRTENNATTHSISLDADYQLGEAWIFEAEYDYNLFTATGGVENNFDFLNASARYQKPGSQWRYELVATNLLNTKADVRNSFGQIFTTTSATFVLPRYIYFKLRYDL